MHGDEQGASVIRGGKCGESVYSAERTFRSEERPISAMYGGKSTLRGVYGESVERTLRSGDPRVSTIRGGVRGESPMPLGRLAIV